MAALPFAAPVEDARHRLWLPVTVRVAWELLLARIRVRPSVLTDAREHVLRCLPEDLNADAAEALTGALTRDYLARVRDGTYRKAPLDPDIGIPVSRVWRERLVAALDPVGDAVLRMHYGDGLSLQEVERHAAIGAAVLATAREGVREEVRIIALEQDCNLEDWPNSRIDPLICRIATTAEAVCPGPAGLLSEAGRDHAGRCPRCSRAVRLIRQGVISPGDLFLPEGQDLVPPTQIGLLALSLHPDGQRHQPALVRALGESALPVGADTWLIPLDEVEALIPALTHLAEQGTPPRHYLRGAAVEGPGRWSRGVLLGPLPVLALEEARSRPWSEVDRVGELPTPLPPPPKATGWWIAAGATAALAALAGVWALRPPVPDPTWPLEATFARADDAWEVRFDVDDLARLSVVSATGAAVALRDADLTAEKGRWATGDGDFQTRVQGDRVALISSPEPLPDLPDLLAASRLDREPLPALRSRLRALHPEVDVLLSPPPPPVPMPEPVAESRSAPTPADPPTP